MRIISVVGSPDLMSLQSGIFDDRSVAMKNKLPFHVVLSLSAFPAGSWGEKHGGVTRGPRRGSLGKSAPRSHLPQKSPQLIKRGAAAMQNDDRPNIQGREH